MLSVIKRYSLQIVFTLSLLLGLQLPNFLQQYELRLQGHFAEAQLQLSQFQSLADVYFSGDLQALINKHKSSQIALFRDEATVIENSYLRVQYLQQKIDNLNKPIWYRLAALTQSFKQPIFKESWNNYKANIILNQQAIIVGLTVAVALMLLLEILLYIAKLSAIFIFKRIRNHTQKQIR
ncbi:DUF2937 family protein [Psychromonas sp. RZ22]|uniref:DUF2937 family protein n=1 Tax=Psychromonas algarum TaxID=2555643 RepID=UPI0010681EE6|nr:DUF2937 family protein [Psychromonas sp. RZ22]TEW54402.1 DUF2937 family protein [Psychromonas sp. RZ22]